MKRLFLTVACVSAASLLSAAAAQADQPVNTVVPRIVGVVSAGRTITARPGEWQSADPLVFTYRWLRCRASGTGCVPLKKNGLKMTGRRLVVPKGLTGSLRVSVVASDAGRETGAISAAVKIR
ncbi:MAG: hypothetical protein ACYDA3_03770 [Gaiellaceae bacterium]